MGMPSSENPWLKADKQPGVTGMDLFTWGRVMNDWDDGWREQDERLERQEEMGALSRLIR